LDGERGVRVPHVNLAAAFAVEDTDMGIWLEGGYAQRLGKAKVSGVIEVVLSPKEDHLVFEQRALPAVSGSDYSS
jgi:hypothetical protein